MKTASSDEELAFRQRLGRMITAELSFQGLGIERQDGL